MSRALASLTVGEVALWLRSVNLVVFAETFPGRHIDGSELVEIEELDEVIEEFGDCGGSKLKLKKLFKLIVAAKAEGIGAAVFAPASVVESAAAPAPAPSAPAAPEVAPTPQVEKAEAPPAAGPPDSPPSQPDTPTSPPVAAAPAIEMKEDTFPDAPPGRVKAEASAEAGSAGPDPSPPPGGRKKVGPPPGKRKARKSRAARPSLVNAKRSSGRAPPGRGPLPPPSAAEARKAANRPKRRTMGGGNQFDVVAVKIFGAKLVEVKRNKFHVYHMKVTLRNRSEYLLERQFAHFKSMYKAYCVEVDELPLFAFPKSKHSGKRFTDRTVAKRIFALQCMMAKIIKRALKKLVPPVCVANFLGLPELEKNLEKTAMRKAKRQSLVGNMEHEFIVSNDFRKKRLGAEIEADKASGRVFVVSTTPDSGGKLRVGDELVSIESELVLGMVIDRVRATLATKARESGVVSMRFKRSGGGGGPSKKKAIMSADAAWGDAPLEEEPSTRLGGDGTDGLPIGWELMNVTHKGADRPLYVNHNKRHTQWEPPSTEDFAVDLDGADLAVSEKDVKCDIKLTTEDEAAFSAGSQAADSDDEDDGDSDEETVAEEAYMMPSARDADEILIAGDSSAAAAMALSGGAQADGIGDRNAAFFRAQKAAKADMAVRRRCPAVPCTLRFAGTYSPLARHRARHSLPPPTDRQPLSRDACRRRLKRQRRRSSPRCRKRSARRSSRKSKSRRSTRRTSAYTLSILPRLERSSARGACFKP